MFPPRSLPDESGRPTHSWRVLLLPYLEQQDLYERYRFDEPWNGPHNSGLADEIPAVYRCPSFEGYHTKRGLDTPEWRRLTNYVALEDADGSFEGTITNARGLSNSLFVIEARQHAVNWMQPDDVSSTEILHDLQAARIDDQANHFGGLQGVFGDGRVEFIPSETPYEALRGWITGSAKNE